MDFKSRYVVLPRDKYFWSTNFWQWNINPFKIFGNLHENTFCFFILSKWHRYYNLTFNDTFKNVLLCIMLI